jgi:hypothetical protein
MTQHMMTVHIEVFPPEDDGTCNPSNGVLVPAISEEEAKRCPATLEHFRVGLSHTTTTS